MTKKLLLLTFISCICTFAFAQKNKDFILTLNQDTIFGNVTLNSSVAHIIFKHKRKKVYFHPKTLKAFGVFDKAEGYKYYKSITNARGTSMFVEVLTEGSFNLYKYQKTKVTANAKYTKNLYYIGRTDEKLSTITPDSYENAIKALVKTHPVLSTKAENSSFNEFPNLVASLNQL